MIFGFSGAHRSGKTTLAKSLCADLGLNYVDASITRIAQEKGFSSVANLDLATRLKLQRHLLEAHVEIIQKAPRPFVIDRTPLDQAAYMLAEVGMHSDGTLGNEISSYLEDCLQVASEQYESIWILRPLPHFEPHPNKPPVNAAYQWHLQVLVEGTASLLRGLCTHGIIMSTDFEERRHSVAKLLVDRLEKLEEERNTFSLH